jgi:hypothetical protein
MMKNFDSDEERQPKEYDPDDELQFEDLRETGDWIEYLWEETIEANDRKDRCDTQHT